MLMHFICYQCCYRYVDEVQDNMLIDTMGKFHPSYLSHTDHDQLTGSPFSLEGAM